MFHFSATFIHIFAMYKKIRTIVFYKEYFQDFFSLQNDKVKDKIIWTLTLIEELERISGHYFKYIEGTDGLYEIRLQLGSDILRIFCFFDSEKLTGFKRKHKKRQNKKL
jgi:hypothetical protein